MQALIFDFDGVIADSETLANLALAGLITDLGVPTTLDQSIARYTGKRLHEVVAAVEADLGRPIPGNFAEMLKAEIFRRFRADLKEVKGARAFIEKFKHVPRCIASSSAPDRLALSLEKLGLTEIFGANVFSADMVEHGKPAPDIYLLAASRIGIAPSECLVIEDGVTGVQAAVAAGMTVIGLLAGSHIRPGHREKLTSAGVHYVVESWEEVGAIAAKLINEPMTEENRRL